MIRGYARNEPPLGWSVERTIRHGSRIMRNHSSPMAHWVVWT